MPVGRIVTGPDPGDGRGLGARRAAVCRATAAGAQESVDGAVPPVLTGLRVAGIRGRLTARHRQQRHARRPVSTGDRKSTRLNSSHLVISYAVFCLKKKKKKRKRK